MAHVIQRRVTKPDNLGSVPGILMVEGGGDTYKLSSDLCAPAVAHGPAHTLHIIIVQNK